ncbi:gamma-type small acid-soluble spore protein [Niallia circulans]|nr:gamma-type small acid-soluble spore protein [Niallia circulans]MCM3092126.1 gamma-type small acid-soluble spore protein [Cytobacillus sp. AMY 15.2]MCM3571447.1 gamma-type small acid-soluble spore protein [Neobacillus mesonae]MCM3707568.1 gamma-type small acid-soluble spore protein [Cytobacillus firmus]
MEQEEPQYAHDGNQASQGSTQVSQGQYGTEFASQNNAQQVRQKNQHAQS